MPLSNQALLSHAIVGVLFLLGTAGGASAGARSVLDFGARPDASADASGAFQAALDAAGAAGGGVVEVPAGRFRFDAPLVVPKHVTLRGMHAYAPSHAGLRDVKRVDERPEFGTVFEVRAGAGDAEGAPFLLLQTNSVLQGVSLYYPDQDPQADTPTPYPYAIAMRGNNPAVLDVQLLNPYRGIDASRNQRALVRNVHGQPLHIGLFVDTVYDIGRIENVHWNPWWSLNSPAYRWQFENGTGFVFARTDWHYVLNTFCFGYNVGYHFTASEHGAANGNFLGIGADDCRTAVLVEESAPMGLLITNGEFVSFKGPDPTMVRVAPTYGGTVRFVNCAFWGPCNRIAEIDGDGVVGFTDCSFMQWGHNQGGVEPPPGGYPAIDARRGSLLVRGCDFMEAKRQIALGPEVERAVITGNLINGPLRIDQAARGTVVIADNAATPDDAYWRDRLRDLTGFRAQSLREARRAEQRAEKPAPAPAPAARRGKPLSW
jgi:hypothetical protein